MSSFRKVPGQGWNQSLICLCWGLCPTPPSCSPEGWSLQAPLSVSGPQGQKKGDLPPPDPRPYGCRLPGTGACAPPAPAAPAAAVEPLGAAGLGLEHPAHPPSPDGSPSDTAEPTGAPQGALGSGSCEAPASPPTPLPPWLVCPRSLQHCHCPRCGDCPGYQTSVPSWSLERAGPVTRSDSGHATTRGAGRWSPTQCAPGPTRDPGQFPVRGHSSTVGRWDACPPAHPTPQTGPTHPPRRPPAPLPGGGRRRSTHRRAPRGLRPGLPPCPRPLRGPQGPRRSRTRRPSLGGWAQCVLAGQGRCRLTSPHTPGSQPRQTHRGGLGRRARSPGDSPVVLGRVDVPG